MSPQGTDNFETCMFLFRLFVSIVASSIAFHPFFILNEMMNGTFVLWCVSSSYVQDLTKLLHRVEKQKAVNVNLKKRKVQPGSVIMMTAYRFLFFFFLI